MSDSNERPTNTNLGESSSGSAVNNKDLVIENESFVEPSNQEGGFEIFKGHDFQGRTIDRDYYSNDLTKVNGVEAFSKASSLYKGVGGLGNFSVDPKTNPNDGKVPKQPFITYDYPTYRGPREQSDFEPYPSRAPTNCHPVISPEASRREDTTVCPDAIHTTWRDLQEQLGRGAGARTNKFLLEFSMPIHNAVHPWKMNVLCKAVSFPTRAMHTASMFRFGRKYNLRGETNFGDSWILTFEEDSELSIRKALDYWFRDIDDSRLQHQALDVYSNMGNPVARLMTTTDDLTEREETEKYNIGGYLSGMSQRPEYNSAAPNYQTDIRVYQLDQTGNKVMGYLMQNAFVSEIGAVEYADDKQNELVSYPVTFTFSEFLPLRDNTLDKTVRVFK